MKWIVLASALLMFASNLPADENAASPEMGIAVKSSIIYPEDLPQDVLLDPRFVLRHAPSQQEFVEVTAPGYPGLKLELPSLKDLIVVTKRTFVFPTHDPAYYQEGGMILAYWGFPMASSQVISTAIPVVP